MTSARYEAPSFETANDLLRAYAAAIGRPIGVPIDVDAIAEFLKVRVEEDASLELDDTVGQIGFKGDQAVVSINPVQNSYEPRRRFTLAHELGHFCLHADKIQLGFKDSKKTMSRSLSYWDAKESEANTFAAQLLMPKELLIKYGQQIIDAYKASNGVSSMPLKEFLQRISSRFAVSNKAMEYRLKNLGIIK